MQQAFVTGGSGFVGRELIAALRSRGVAVRALARSQAAAQQVAALGAQAVMGDLDASADFSGALVGCDVVFHAAAKVDDRGARAEFLRVNVQGTERLLSAARDAGVARFVHVGTEGGLVGDAPLRMADESTPAPRRHAHFYGESKALAEVRVLAANGATFHTVSIRPRMIWGLGDTTILPRLVALMNAGRFAWIDGGHYRVSTCHVRNVVEGLLLGATKARGGEAYFITDGEPVEFREFITALVATQRVQAGDRSVPRGLLWALASVLEPLGLTPPMSRSAIRMIGEECTVRDDKARRELGYTGSISIASGLEELAAAARRAA